MNDLDIWGTSRKMIELYGGNAELTAAQRADGARDGSDLVKLRRWLAITVVVNDLAKRNSSTRS
ncbi:MAG TPA: hypothetical protein VHZ32_04550 [Rhizomicrobium sp.]|jgi:hypothetical protein|nr:hypothetical protein [Rhizomicrobium sp.]